MKPINIIFIIIIYLKKYVNKLTYIKKNILPYFYYFFNIHIMINDLFEHI